MKKKIIILGHKGFIGARLFKEFKKKKFDVIGIKIPRPNYTEDIKKFYIDYINKILIENNNVNYVINCAGSISCKTNSDFFFNSEFDIIFQNIVLKKKMSIKYLTLNSTKVFTNCLDKYTLSKKELNKNYLSKNNFYILYLDLIFQKDSIHYKKIFDLLKKWSYFKIPIFYPGKLFYPIDLNNLCKEIFNITTIKQNKNKIIILGDKKFTFYEIIVYVKKKSFLQNKFRLLKSKYFNSMPNFVKNIFYRSKFLQMMDDKNWLNYINQEKFLLKKIKTNL